jgi:hypothetical protein
MGKMVHIGPYHASKGDKMRQQQVMENFAQEWLITSQNLGVIRANLGNSKTEEHLTTKLNQLERILNSHGFTYIISVFSLGGNHRHEVLFRKQRAAKLRNVMKNWAKKHIDYPIASMGMYEANFSQSRGC